MKGMAPRRFVLGFMAALLLAAVAIVGLTFWAGHYPERHFTTYQAWLAQASADQRKVLVDAGSSSMHSLDTARLTEFFGRPVIVLADNAGRPLEHKLYRIEALARPGDIVLLALEWHYYTKDETSLPANYLEELLTWPAVGYFPYLSREEQLRVAFEHVDGKIFGRLVREFSRSLRGRLDEFEREQLPNAWYRTWSVEQGGSRHFSGTHVRESDRRPGARGKSGCDRYVLGAVEKEEWALGQAFLGQIARMQALQARGVQVWFTWPPVVGEHCYESKVAEPLPKFQRRIAEVVEGAGFRLLGSADELPPAYDDRYYYDTHYHLNRAGAALHTDWLIAALQDAGVQRDAEPTTLEPVLATLRTRLRARAREIGMEDRLLLELPQWEGAPLRGEALYPFVLGRMWEQRGEEWHSLGRNSYIELNLAADPAAGTRLCVAARQEKGKPALVYLNGAHAGQLGKQWDGIVLPPGVRRLDVEIINPTPPAPKGGNEPAPGITVLKGVRLAAPGESCRKEDG